MSGSLFEVMDALAGQLEQQISPAIVGLQVSGRMLRNPTPPALDMYPGDPFGEAVSFNGREQLLTIRARVSGADDQAGQELLLALMDWTGAASVIAAVKTDPRLQGTVDDTVVEGPSGFIAYADASGAATGSLLGCEWRLRCLL